MNTARAIVIAAILLALPVLVPAMGDTPQPASKPSAPLVVEITQLPPTSGMPGSSVHLSITVRSLGASGEVDVRLRLTGGAALVQGEERWAGELSENGTLSRNIIVQASRQGNGAVMAEASIKDSHSGMFKAHARYRIGESAEPAPKEGRTGRDSTGREVEEYPAR